jgi:hypothetical protein
MAKDAGESGAKPKGQSRNSAMSVAVCRSPLLHDLSFNIKNTDMMGFATPIDAHEEHIEQKERVQ